MLAAALWWNHPMRHTILILVALLAGGAGAPSMQAVPGYQRSNVTLAATRTGKERLSDKSSDEQRLDDCKVPEARRTKARPANCRAEH
jgi:hypothetical protein